LFEVENEVSLVRKVELNMTEELKYEIIKKLVETNGNKKAAALKLNCTQRHVNRLIKGYLEEGKAFFQHGNKGRKPVNSIDERTVREILTLYDNKYYDANFTHLSELLERHEGITVSKTFLRELFLKNGILSPMATRKVKRRLKEYLENRKKEATSTREKNRIQDLIVSIEDSHPRRPRARYFGELVQMDASVHLWFGDVPVYLHLAIDDCTGRILGAFFARQETLYGYYNVLHQILVSYGIPACFYTDNRTIFEYKRKGTPKLENDTFTQFGYACKQLGIELKTTSVPEAKGRVERMFGTLQSRLPIELRLAGVTTLEQANEFLTTFIEEFNAQFALTTNHSNSVFEAQPSNEQINLILAVITHRVVDKGHSIKFNKKFYFPVKDDGSSVYYRKGTSCLVIQAFDGNLYAVINDSVHALDEIPEHEPTSKNFDLPEPVTEPKKRYIPPMSHPWKAQEFSKHVAAQPHREIPEGVTYEDLWYTIASY
jgi:transposase